MVELLEKVIEIEKVNAKIKSELEDVKQENESLHIQMNKIEQ